jgi:hypothetical protein
MTGGKVVSNAGASIDDRMGPDDRIIANNYLELAGFLSLGGRPMMTKSPIWMFLPSQTLG